MFKKRVQGRKIMWDDPDPYKTDLGIMSHSSFAAGSSHPSYRAPFPSNSVSSASPTAASGSHSANAASAGSSYGQSQIGQAPLPSKGPAVPSTTTEDTARIFNTAIVSTQVGGSRDFSQELAGLVDSPAFRSILSAVKQHARLQGISEKVAAEQIIQTFRCLDRAWTNYVFQEGVERLRAPSQN